MESRTDKTDTKNASAASATQTMSSFFAVVPVKLVFSPVGIRDRTQNTAGISRGKHAGGDVFRHDASGTDHDIIADRHAGKHRDIAADPDVISHGDRKRIFQPAVALFHIERMPGV